MDSPGDWTESALFSPSKARAQQAQARDWAYVDTWLAKTYGNGKRFPTFERNECTLQALLSLATLNEDADEQRFLVDKVEKVALQAQSKRTVREEDSYRSLLDSLSGDGAESLDALAGTATLLRGSDVGELAARLCDLTAKKFELTEAVKRAESQHATIIREQSRLSHVIDELRNDDFQAPSNLPEQTVEWSRNTKQLKAKVAEYDERLSTLRSTPLPTPTLEDIVRHTTDVKAHRAQLDGLNADLSAFDSLPSDPKAAKAKLESARSELRSLTSKRDKLFEDLVDSQ